MNQIFKFRDWADEKSFARFYGGKAIFSVACFLLTSHNNFILVESTDVALISSTTSPDSRLARASLKSRSEFNSSCVGKEKEKKKLILFKMLFDLSCGAFELVGKEFDVWVAFKIRQNSLNIPPTAT